MIIMLRNLALAVVILLLLLVLGASRGEKVRPYTFALPEEKTAAIFPAPELEAGSAYVFDLTEQKILFEKNSGETRPLASLAKLMTALLLEELVPEGFFIPITPEAVRQEGDDGFRAGESFRKEDFEDLIMVASSNDAAWAAAEFIGVSQFVSLMNERAEKLGMLNTSFLNPHGLDPGAEGTAREMGILMEYIFRKHPGLLEKTRQPEITITSQEGRVITAKNTNRALELIPQLIGAKTGFTDLAGGNLAFIFDAGFSRPVLVVLLGSSFDGRFEDAKRIVQAVFKYYALQ